jgi:hypothetical protein
MGNRIDNRARGNAPQLLEKYKTLARDAQQSGDRVLAEYYFQFADHYFRVLAESRARFEEANPNRPRQEYSDNENEGFDGEGNDGDMDDAFDAPRPQQARQDNRPDNRSEQQPRQYRDDRPRNDQNREDRPRNDQNRDDRPRNDQPRQDREPRPERMAERSGDDRPARTDRYQRDDRPRNDQPRSDQPREDRPRDDRPREARPRLDRNRTAAPRAQANGNGADHDDDFDHGNALPFDALPPAIGVSAMEPVLGVEGEVIPVPKKRGRPKKVVTEVATEE